MNKFIKLDLHFDREIVAITIVSTLLLIVDRYHNFTGYKALDRVFIYLLIPLLVVVLAFRQSPKEFGFQLGDWKAGLAITLGAMALIGPVIWFVVRADDTMRSYYEYLFGPALPVMTFLDLIGWEFFFRGWLLFGYARKFGDHALWLQAVPFAIAHIGKPEIETLSTIFGGFLFGVVAWRTKSFLYPFLIHWFVFTFTVFVAGYTG